MEIKKYGIKLRPVEISDARFILELRTNPELNKYLSFTENNLDNQIEWIKKYKEREIKGEEFYFIAEDINGNCYGTTRIYNFIKDSFETGSWLFSKSTPQGLAIKADIIGREFGFDMLKVNFCHFEVKKNNKTVVRYHLGYEPDLINEDEQNFYFKLSKEKFENHKNKLLKIH